MDIIDRIKNLFPGQQRPVRKNSPGKYQPDSWIEWMDVNRIAMAIRSARGGNTVPLFALYRDIVICDSHIQSELNKRKLAVLGDIFRIMPYDKKSEADRATAVAVEKAIYGIPKWRNAIAHLLDSSLWPVAILEKVYEADGVNFKIARLQPVPATSLDYSTGSLMIQSTDEDGKPMNDLLEPDPARYIIHRGHLLSFPDQFGGPMRSLIFWWLCSTMTQDWWVRFLEHFGAPFIVGKYDPNNADDRAVVTEAISCASRLMGVAVSKDAEILLEQVAAGSADAYEKFIAVAERKISKLILGQTLSSNTDPTGMGSGVSDLQGEVREDVRKYDAQMIAETLRDDLFTQFCAINRMPGQAPYMVWGQESVAEQKATADVLVSLRGAGFRPTDDALEPLSEKFGFTIERDSNVNQTIPGMFPNHQP